jgi:hypothetical protein
VFGDWAAGATAGMPTDRGDKPDAGGPDNTLDPYESTDSDDVRNRDGDENVDPPEGWSEADKWGVTAWEQLHGEPLDMKLAEEEPDFGMSPRDRFERNSADDDDDDDEDPDEVPLTDVQDFDDDIPPAEFALKHADAEHRVILEEPAVDRLQIDGTPEDGDSIFPLPE